MLRFLSLLPVILFTAAQSVAQDQDAADFYIEAADVIGDEFLREIESHWLFGFNASTLVERTDLLARIGVERVEEANRLIDLGNSSESCVLGAREWLRTTGPEDWLDMPRFLERMGDLVLFVEFQTTAHSEGSEIELFTESVVRSLDLLSHLLTEPSFMFWLSLAEYAEWILDDVSIFIRDNDLDIEKREVIGIAVSRLRGDDVDPYRVQSIAISQFRWMAEKASENPVEVWAAICFSEIERMNLKTELAIAEFKRVEFFGELEKDDEFKETVDDAYKDLADRMSEVMGHPPHLESAQELAANIRVLLGERDMKEADFPSFIDSFINDFSQAVKELSDETDIGEFRGIDFYWPIPWLQLEIVLFEQLVVSGMTVDSLNYSCDELFEQLED